MPIQKKTKYNLARLLTKIVWQANDAKTFCDETLDDTDPGNIVRLNYNHLNIAAMSPQDMWSSIITAAENQNLLRQLLEAIKTKNPGNTDLTNFYDEIKSGFERRVENIAKAIKKNECVLFMGPELLQCIDEGKAEAFNRLFSIELSERLYNAGVYFDQELNYSISYIANRFEDMPNVANRELGNEAVKSFEKANVYTSIFEKIAELNFPLIISTNPDDLLEKEYKQRNIPFSSGYYDRSNLSKNNITYDDNKTIIYKIFGSFENPFSILFTDNDRVQFSKNVVKNDPPIPPVVKVLLENKYYLFLGFNFQEWHLKILIDCLGLAKKEERSFALLLDNANESSIEHFEKNYKFYFINEKVETFLDDVINVVKTIP